MGMQLGALAQATELLALACAAMSVDAPAPANYKPRNADAPAPANYKPRNARARKRGSGQLKKEWKAAMKVVAAQEQAATDEAPANYKPRTRGRNRGSGQLKKARHAGFAEVGQALTLIQ